MISTKRDHEVAVKILDSILRKFTETKPNPFSSLDPFQPKDMLAYDRKFLLGFVQGLRDYYALYTETTQS